MQTEVEIIPDVVESKFPDIAAIMEAISAYRDGRELKVFCPTCKHILTVTDLPEINSLWISCDTGCTNYHQRYQPVAESYVPGNGRN